MTPLTSFQKKIVTGVLDLLKSAKVPHVVLRNYEGLPDASGRDIDLFLPRKDLSRCMRLISSLVDSASGVLGHVYERDHLISLYICRREHEDWIHLDLYHGAYTWRGLKYLQDTELLSAAAEWKGIPIPGPSHEALILLMANLLDGGFVKHKYINRIRHLLADPTANESFRGVIKSRFGHRSLREVEEVLKQADSSNVTSLVASAFRKRMVWRALARRPMKSCGGFIRFLFAEWKRVLRPAGLVVVVTGPDGAGKSTVIERLTSRLRTASARFHWRPGLLPEVGVLLKSRRKSADPACVHDNPHGRRPHGLAVSMARTGYYWLDYWLGWTRILSLTAKNRTVVFDRYAIDMQCDPRRFRLSLPPLLLRLFCRVVPQPDAIFALYARGTLFFERKPETSAEESQRQSECYREVALLCKGGHVIDASKPVEEVVEAVYAQVTKLYRERAARWLSRRAT